MTMPDLTTAEEVMKFWDNNRTKESKDEEYEVQQIKKDLATANEYLTDAIARYRKKKLRAKSKAAAQAEDPFKDLEGYDSENAIADAYGWDAITENEMKRLMNLWELREAQKNKRPTPYTDEVTGMLDRARAFLLTDEQEDKLKAYERKRREMWEQAVQVARENSERARERLVGAPPQKPEGR